MGEILSLSGSELAALADYSLGKKQAADGPIASLVKRGLATLDGDAVSFSPSLTSAFQPMADCLLNVILMNDAGSPADQFYLGQGDTGSHLIPDGEGLQLEPLSRDQLPGAVVRGLNELLATGSSNDLPIAESFANACEVLGLGEVKALAWGGLILARPNAEKTEGEESAGDEWILVVRAENGIVWQDPVYQFVAVAETDEELAELVADVLARA